MKKKYLKFMPFQSVVNASRNKRELSAALEYGFETYCYSSDRNDKEQIKTVCASMIYNETPPVTADVKPKIRKYGRKIINLFRHAKRLRQLNMDVISCHNIEALSVAYMAYMFTSKKKRPLLIYDAHEMELEKKKRNWLSYRLVKINEAFLMKRSVFTITINEGIAEELKKVHRLSIEPIVVRSTPECWQLSDERIHNKRLEYLEKLNASQDAFIIEYSGFFMENRGIEAIFEALSRVEGVYAVLIGEARSKKYFQKLMDLMNLYQIKDKVLFYPLQPMSELQDFVAAVDAAIVMNEIKNRNYLYALPNKFFEAIQSLTPIICTNSMEMSKIVNHYNIGELVETGDAIALAKTLEKWKNGCSDYKHMKENLKVAKNELCWENERNILFDAFEKYL